MNATATMDSRRRWLFEAISKASGLPVDQVGESANLELDLGLDSIRMIGLMGTLMESAEEPIRANLASLADEGLSGIDTVGAILRRVSPQRIAAEEELELLDAQVLFLLSAQMVGSNSLCSSVRLRGPWDASAARTALGRVVARHPALRSRFVFPQGRSTLGKVRWVALSEIEPPAIQEVDFSGIAPDLAERACEDLFAVLLNRAWDLGRAPLFELRCAHLPDGGQELFLAVEHIVSDGLGNQRILHEFLEEYEAALRGGATGRVGTSAQEWNSAARAMNAHVEPGERELLDRYREQVGRSTFCFVSGRGRPIHEIPDFRSLRVLAPAGILEGLQGLVGSTRRPMYPFLVAAWLRTVAELSREEGPILLQLPTSGQVYPNIQVPETVSCFAQNLCLPFDRPAEGESWTDLVERIHRSIRASIQGGLDRAQTRQLGAMTRSSVGMVDGRIPPEVLAMARSGVKSNLYFPFTGQAILKADYGPIVVESYRAGTINSPGAIDVLQEIWNGRLVLNMNYDALSHEASFATAMVERYFHHLEDLVSRADSPSPASGLPEPPIPEARLAALLREAGGVLKRRLEPADAGKDLEARLGLDSLARVRLVTRLLSSNPDLDADALFDARSLLEMAAVLEGGAPSVPQAPGSLEVAPSARPDDFGHVPELEGEEVPVRHIVRQFAKVPEVVAVKDAQASLTYGQLGERTGKLAGLLASRGVGRGAFVAVLASRGTLFSTGMVAALRAGAAYVPIEPSFPPERMGYILGHCRAAALLVQSSLLDVLLRSGTPLPSCVILLDDSGSHPHAEPASAWLESGHVAPDIAISPDDRMVVLYTSGSTGQPKGVVLKHRGYYHRIRWHHRTFGLSVGESVAQKTSCCFDVSIWELFWPLMVGGTQCAAEKSVAQNPWKLAAWARRERIGVMHFVPPMFAEFVDANESRDLDLPDLRWLIFSGEALGVPVVRKWMSRYGGRVGLANLYGPTEASIDVTCERIDRIPGPDQPRIPIGAAIDRVDLLVVGPDGNRLPAGELGELCIAGVYLAEGYLHDPERTAKAFVPNRFPDISGPVLYRTGDLCRELPGGVYDYHGRIDNQVKIRGFRIELGEIESVLAEQRGVVECCVLAVDSGDAKLLVAWVTGTPGTEEEIRSGLGRKLTEYMVPHRVLHRAVLPKNNNGKIDRKALLQDWAEVAEGRDDRVVYPAPEPDGGPGNESQEAPAADAAAAPLLPAQRWLLEQFRAPHLWAGTARLELHQELHPAAFRAALSEIVSEHEALRTEVFRDGAGWRQRVVAGVAVEPTMLDGSGLPEEMLERGIAAATEASLRDLSPDAAPAMKVFAVRLGPSRWEILFVAHHMVADLVSARLLHGRFLRAYFRALGGEVPAQAPARSPLELARKLQDLCRGPRGAEILEHYRSRLCDDPPAPLVPDRVCGSNRETATSRIDLVVPPDVVVNLRARLRSELRNSFHGLVSGTLCAALSEATGNGDVVLGHRTHGREPGEGLGSFAQSMGNFAVNHPVRVDRPAVSGLAAWVAAADLNFQQAPLGGLGYDMIGTFLPCVAYPDHRVAPVRLNHLGSLDVPEGGVLRVSSKGSGLRLGEPEQERSAEIEVLTWFEGDAFHLRWEFSASRWRSERIRGLAERHLAMIRELAAGVEAAK